MTQKSRFSQLIFVAFVLISMNSSLLAAWRSARAPAGQMCAMGSYVIGFDSESNIICTEACGNGVLNPGESCDDGNVENGDSCPASCQSGVVKATGADADTTAEAAAAAKSVSPPPSSPIISAVKPSTLTFGTRELTIKVSGTGFHADSTIIFNGTRYSPSVNQVGTQITVTIPTRELNIGRYAITVSNGTGMETTLKKALEVY